MNQTYPKPPTPESLEGDAGHWCAWEMQAGRLVVEGQIAPNGVVVTEEMIDGGELMCEAIKLRFSGGTFSKPVIEERVLIPRVHQQCWGTPDVWGWSLEPFIVELLDYKFGHRFVDEYENDQCVTYIAGIIDAIAATLGLPVGQIDQRLRINITVVQPRCFYKGSPVRTWSVMASDLRGHINSLQMAADASLKPNPTATTNSECIDCPGRHACPALQKAAYSDAEFAAQSPPVELPPAAASLELHMMERSLERLQARVEGMREVVAVYSKQGHSVPFHRAEQSYGRQVWNVPNEQVIAMGQMFGADLTKVSVKTPKQAAKMLVDEAVINAYSFTPLGSMKLIPNNPADARRVFGITLQNGVSQ